MKGVEKMLREARSRMRMDSKTGECFWTVRGVWQECPFSPLLLNILIAGLEEEMGRMR